MEQNIYELSDKLNYIMNVKESDKDRFKDMISWAGEMIDLTIKERIVKDLLPKKGDVWTCNMGINVGCELNKVRPVIIISNDIGNTKSPIITVVPISHREGQQPTQVNLSPEDFSFMENSITGTSLAEQIKVVSKARLGRKIGELNSTAMTKVELSILVSLGMIGENV
jgi:mRNA interferase MazF